MTNNLSIKGNEHKKVSNEDKFGRKYYCQRASRFIKHQKRANNKRFRKNFKNINIDEVLNEIE